MARLEAGVRGRGHHAGLTPGWDWAWRSTRKRQEATLCHLKAQADRGVLREAGQTGGLQAPSPRKASRLEWGLSSDRRHCRAAATRW